MIYKFRSQATGDVIMMESHGDQFLSVIGRQPAPKGILEVDHMADALRRIDAALQAEGDPDDGNADDGGDGHKPDPVSLRQRLWPMAEMIRQAQAAGQPIVWGV